MTVLKKEEKKKKVFFLILVNLFSILNIFKSTVNQIILIIMDHEPIIINNEQTSDQDLEEGEVRNLCSNHF